MVLTSLLIILTNFQHFITCTTENPYIQIVNNFDNIKQNNHLATLIIQGNGCTVNTSDINPNTFAKVPNLEELFIYNILNDLDTNIFSPITSSLTHLKLQDNNIPRLGASVFQGLDLEKLKLTNNKIQEIDTNAFNGMMTSMLDLSYNNLCSLPSLCMVPLRLYKLSLANNKLSNIALNTFGPELAYVDLSNNQLKECNCRIFDNMYGLSHVNLSGNHLTSIVASPSMTNLKILDLSRNNINYFSDDAFVYYKNLRELYLNDNKILELSYKSFPPTTLLKVAFINNNYLTHLQLEIAETFPDLAFFKFGGNPWSCACLEAIIEIIKSRRIGTDSCERGLIQQGGEKFCVKMYKKCYGNETRLLLEHFDLYTEFIKNYEC